MTCLVLNRAQVCFAAFERTEKGIAMSFSELGLDPLILKSVLAAGYETATPVQMQAIPAALSGRDLLVSSHTGSGKTERFCCRRSSVCRPSRRSRAWAALLVLTPTRELRAAVEKAA